MDKAIPERVWIDRGPRGGWMMRDKKMPDSEHEYVRTDLMPAALTAAGWRLVPPGGDGQTVERCAAEAKLAALQAGSKSRRTKTLGLRRDTYPHEYGNEIATALRSLNGEA